MNMPRNIIRAKGLVWYSGDDRTVHIFEQAGKQVSSFEAGRWVASFSKRKIAAVLEENPHLAKNWDETVGDRIIKVVFIGQNMNEKEIVEKLLVENMEAAFEMAVKLKAELNFGANWYELK